MAGSTDPIDRLRIERPVDDGEGRRWLWPGLTVAAVAGVLVIGAWWWLAPSGAIEVRVVSPREVELGAIDRQTSVLDASGYVVARRQATVSAKVTGKITDVLVEEGMQVEAGQVLARLDAVIDEAELELARARLRSAQSAVRELEVLLGDARRTLERQVELRSRGLTSEAELDAARANMEGLEARLQARRDDARVAQLSVGLRAQLVEELIIRAPFAGVVVAKAAQPGEMVSPISAGGGFTRTGICTIVDMDSLEIEVDVNEAYIQRVSAGQPATAALDAYPDWEIPARVIAIVPTADRQRATVRVRVGLQEQDARILPDMGVRVRFLEPDQSDAADDVVTPRRGLRLPAAAVRREDGRHYVYVVDRDRVQRRAVQVAEQRGNDVLVTAGLRAGEQVVADVTGVSLSDNQRVSVKGEQS